MNTVTRFAPSPTGSLHVGGLRTAIFSYLWARHNHGKFLLRIEDTDRERLVPGSVKEIENSLRWLGLEFDDELIYQSERKEIHQKYAEKLIKEGKAYKCYCTKERLNKLREEQLKKKLPPGYDKRCRNLSQKEMESFESSGKPYVIRFAMPESGFAEWDDAVRGKMSVKYALSDDQVLLKSSGWPTYFLAATVDDHEAGVTDIIRGEEWLPSTPKNIAIYKAFGWNVPRFAHMPVTVGPSGKKLSKRDGDTAVSEYMAKGYLPEALLNFLVFLGWNPKTTEEFFSKGELINIFDIKDINKAPAVFDVNKLNWINAHYIRSIPKDKLKMLIKNLIPSLKILKLSNFNRILDVEKIRLTRLTDIQENTDFYLENPKINPNLLIFKKSTLEATKMALNATYETLDAISNPKWKTMDIEDFNAILAKIVAKNNFTNGDVFWPVRYALSGLEKSASPAELLWAMDKDTSLTRISISLKVLN